MARWFPSAFLLILAGVVTAQDKPEDAERVVQPLENRQHGVMPYRKHIEREGIAVEVAIDHLDPVNKVPGFFMEGDQVKISFKITDTATGSPLSNAYPAGWLDLVPPGETRNEKHCTDKLKAFLGGGLFGTPEINLNEYYVVALNRDATLTVVDPQFGFGGTRLLAMVPLDSPGGDWALTSDQARLFVSMTEAGKIAVVDCTTWKVRARLESGPNPVRTVLQPDGYYLWSAYRGKDGASAGGVVAFRTDTLEEAARFSTGAGAHDIVFDRASKRAFISNEEAGTVAIIDVRALRKIADIATGSQPVSLAYSPLAQAVYVSHRNGTVAVIDATDAKLDATLQAEPGLGQIAFAPGDRYAFLLNEKENLVHIIDATARRIIQTGYLLKEPDQVAFTDNIAYIRHRGSETVLMVALAEIGVEGKPVAVVDFPGGQMPPGKMSLPTPAAGIVQAPGANAVLVANGPDEAIYFYKEGMAAPMGNFANYSHEPRAVEVIDRSLKENTRPGLYETFVRLGQPGLYDLVFFMDSPRLAQCMAVPVAADPAAEADRKHNLVSVQFKPGQRIVAVGKPVTLDFSIIDQNTGKAREDLTDVMVLVNLQPGIWHKRYPAKHQGGGVFHVTFTPPRRGVYYVFASSKTVELGYGNTDYIVMRAGPAKNPNPHPQKTEKDRGGG